MTDEPHEPSSEEEPQDNSAELNKRQTYRVLINSKSLETPIDEFVDLPTYLAEDYIESATEKILTTSQEVKREALVAYLNDYFLTDQNVGEMFTSENIVIEHPSVEES